MKAIAVFLTVLCVMVTAFPVFGEEYEIYGRKLLDIDVAKAESALSSIGRPAPGEMPSEEWFYTNGLIMLSKYQLDPLWSPDGQWIACTESFMDAGLWLIPVDGGDPVRIYSNIWTYQGYYVGCGHLRLLGFTSDGEEIVINTFIIDETRGTEVTLKFHQDGSFRGRSISNALSVMLAVDINTGESRVLVENSFYGIYSPDGKYFAYNKRFQSNTSGWTMTLFVQDTSTGDEWDLGEIESGFCFSHDSASIIYTDNNQLHIIPVTGGNSEQITFEDGDELTIRHYFPECSPDGEWILFSGNGGPRENTISDSTGSHSYSTPTIPKLCAFNVYTDETIEFFPREPAISSRNAKFSPDGSQFCYQYENKDQRHQSIEIYIKDFDLPSQKKEIQVAAGDIQLSVDDESPSGFALKGNYPNPFNPSTTIEFSLPEADFADLAIYNLAGQKIRELVSGTLSEGIHSVVWNGRDGRGLPVSAGVYLTRLRMNDAVVTGRMTLVK